VNSHRKVISEGFELTRDVVPEKWSTSVGLFYQDLGYKAKICDDYLDYNTKNLSVQYSYLTTPVSIQIHQGRFYFGLGLNASYFLQGKRTQSEQTTEVKVANLLLFGINTKVGATFQTSDNFKLRTELYGVLAQPRFFGLYSFGLGIGLDCKLNNKKATNNK
jgi:hypothetical protein